MIDVSEELKDLLKNTECRKEVVISFPNGEHEDITNDSIIAESLEFTESICSQQELEFGLCEASVLKFSTINIENIKNCTINAEIIINNENISLGEFIVSECNRDENNLQIRNIVAYDTGTYYNFELPIRYKDIFDKVYTKQDGSNIANISYGELLQLTTPKTYFKNNEKISIKDESKNNKVIYTQKIFDTKEIIQSKVYGSEGYYNFDGFFENGISLNNTHDNEVYDISDALEKNNGEVLASITGGNNTYEIFVIIDSKYKILSEKIIIENFIPLNYQTNDSEDYDFYFSIYVKNECSITKYSYDKKSNYKIEVEGYTPKEKYDYLLMMPSNHKPFNKTDIFIVKKTIERIGEVFPFFIQETGEYIESWEDKTNVYSEIKIPKGGIELSHNNYLRIYDKLETLRYKISFNNELQGLYFKKYEIEEIEEEGYYRGYGTCNYYYKPRNSYLYDSSIPVEICNMLDKYEKVVAFDGIYKVPPFLFFPTKITLKDTDNNVLLYRESDKYSDIEYVKGNIENAESNYVSKMKYSYETSALETGLYYATKDINGTFYTDKKYAVEQFYKAIIPTNTREMVESYIELLGKFGKIGRDGTFKTLSLESENTLYPANDTYPSDSTYPGTGGDIGSELYTKKIYRKCFYDDDSTLPYGKITCKCKQYYTDESGEEKVNENATYEYVIREEPEYIDGILNIIDENYKGYKNYDVSDNFVIKNHIFDNDFYDMESILKYMADNIKNIQYMPTKLSAKGLPYVEAGDMIQVITDGETIKTYALRRTMKGIQQLTDSIIAN